MYAYENSLFHYEGGRFHLTERESVSIASSLIPNFLTIFKVNILKRVVKILVISNKERSEREVKYLYSDVSSLRKLLLF